MKINFKQPKYVLPLLLLPFLCLFYYVWQGSGAKKEPLKKTGAAINPSVGNVSAAVQKKNLLDKLDAFRSSYKDAGGPSAVSAIPGEESVTAQKNAQPAQPNATLDSVRKAIKSRYVARQPPTTSANDRELAQAINSLKRPQKSPAPSAPARLADPMETFKQQMAYMDSLGKLNDPEMKAERQKQQALEKRRQQEAQQKPLRVSKAGAAAISFNTVKPETERAFIKAVIDEEVTCFAGSRLRLRLLDDIFAGNILIPKDTYIYALISGFSEQRVTLSVRSVIVKDKILPVKLEVYDLDGLPGLYVPASAFRDFTRDLGANAVQGVIIDGSSPGNQFIMSSVDKLFQSTSSAIAGLVRKNKARLKYNSYIFLIDTDALQNAQKP